MGKCNDAMELSTWTTGSGIVIGTNVDLAGVFSGAATTTVTLKSGSTTLLVTTGAGGQLAVPVALEGAITGTSSGGSFSVLFRKRNV